MEKIFYFIIVAATFGLSGCGAMLPTQSRLLMSGQFGELERHMEEKVSNIQEADNWDITDMCLAYVHLKRYSKTQSCLEEIQRRIDRGDDTRVFYYGQYLGDIEVLHGKLKPQILVEMGEYPNAIIQANKALEVIERSTLPAAGEAEMEVLQSMGLAYALSGQREEAERCLARLDGLSTAFTRILLKNTKYLAIARINIALGRYDRALAAFQVLKESGGLQFFRAAATITAAATVQVGEMWTWLDLPVDYTYFKVLLETGDTAQAKQGFDELLKVPQAKDNGPIYWLILFDRGRIAELEGSRQEAIDLYRQAVDIIEPQRSTINTEASKIGFVGDKQAVYARLIDALSSDKQYSAALEYIERSKSRALVDMLAKKKDFSVQAGDAKQIRELLALKEQSEQELFVQNTSTEAARTRGIAFSSKEKLQQQAPELSSLVSVTSLSVREIQEILPPDETLVEYYYSDKQLSVFALSSGGLSAVRLDINNLPENIKNFRQSISDGSSNTHEALGRQLYNTLIKPIEKSLSTSKLIIVAHGALHYLPFYALHDGQEFLIERYSIRMLPSASVMKYLRKEKSNKSGNILAFGNPDLGNPQYDLIYAQNEAVAVSKTMPNSKVLLRNDATETALDTYGSGFDYIHFATHGVFDTDAPLNSGLLLAKDKINDGKLTVDKLYSMKLDADLVTLSACETGLGKIANGDDVVGLTRGFLYAGSNSVVASLWKVDDLATSSLMMAFYDALKTTDKREALRLAQLQTKEQYNHPYFWSAFQLTGNAQ